MAQDKIAKTSNLYIEINFSGEVDLKERMEKAITKLLSFVPKKKETF